MGAMQNNNQKAGNKSSKRGSTRNDNRLQAFSSGGTPGGAGWDDCLPDKLQAVIVGITALGGAVIFGLSRDMGAHSVTLLLGKDRMPLWFNGDAELDDELDAVIHTLSQMEA